MPEQPKSPLRDTLYLHPLAGQPALWILARDLGCFEPAWRGGTLRRRNLFPPEGWEAIPGGVLSMPLLRAQVSAYQARERQVLAMEEQALPGELPTIVAS